MDVLAAFTLLIAVMSVATPLAVRQARLIKANRDYRLALDELSNQMDRLTALSPAQLPQAVEQLAPSDFVAARLPDSKLTGELAPAEIGTRITLQLAWKDSPAHTAPASLAAWVFPTPPQPSPTPQGSQPQ
jgi:hypothetical protein